MPFTKKRKILYCAGIALVLISLPVGEALKDYGIIHAIGLLVFFTVFTSMTRQLYRYWKSEKSR